ncbi:hypothetical protein AJ87_13065 [Rhizobium yanglingense]|nr:hypothetical protein AJ87_13065 [Rhizobium yanglingense]
MLGDINYAFVEMLRRFRALNFRFGFISDQRGLYAGSPGRSEAATLIGMLDELLSIDGALPDFWMACAPSQRSGTELQHRLDQQIEPDASTILQTIEWYEVDKGNCVFVSSSSAGIRAAEESQVVGIQYSGWQGDMRAEARGLASPVGITDIQQLGAKIQEIVVLRHRRTA